MSFLVDANLLIYATLTGSPEHRVARAWLQDRFEDRDGHVALAWSTLFALTRLVSNRRVLGDDAVSVATAWATATAFLDQPTARLVEPGPFHAAVVGSLMATPGLVANDVPDVQLAALAIEHGLVLASHDAGFARFDGLRWHDPLKA